MDSTPFDVDGADAEAGAVGGTHDRGGGERFLRPSCSSVWIVGPGRCGCPCRVQGAPLGVGDGPGEGPAAALPEPDHGLFAGDSAPGAQPESGCLERSLPPMWFWSTAAVPRKDGRILATDLVAPLLHEPRQVERLELIEVSERSYRRMLHYRSSGSSIRPQPEPLACPVGRVTLLEFAGQIRTELEPTVEARILGKPSRIEKRLEDT